MNRVPVKKRKDLFWDWSWNPITGCKNGCTYCYAKTLAGRFPAIHGQEWTKPKFHPERMTNKDLRQPKDGQRVFVCSMADIFSAGVNPAWVRQVQEAVKTRPLVHFLFLTKCPDQYKYYLPWPENAWLGVSMDSYITQVERAKSLNRVQHYGIKWINAAPALDGPMDDLAHYFNPDWLVAEPLHGRTNATLEYSEAKVHAWHRWAIPRKVPIWIKGMKHWGVRCPIPKELPTLRREQ